MPNKVVIFNPVEEKKPTIHRLVPFVSQQVSLGGKATAYVCRNFSCHQPTVNIKKMLKLLTEQ